MSREIENLKDWLKTQIEYYKSHEMYPAFCMNATVKAYETVLNKIEEAKDE